MSSAAADSSPRPAPRAESLRARLARGTVWSAINTVATRLISLGTSVLLARALGATIFGRLGVVQSTVGMFGMLAALGTSVTATKFVAEHRVSDRDRAGRIIGFTEALSLASALAFAILFIAFAPLLARHSLGEPALASSLRVATLILVLNAINGAKSGALAGFEEFRLIATIDGIGAAVSAGLSLLGVWLGGLDGALWGMGAALVLQSAAYSWAVQRVAARNGIRVRWLAGRDEWQVLARFSLPALMAALSATAVNWGCMAMIVNQPDGYREMGIFGAADRWRQAIMFVPATLSAALLPVLSNLVGQRDRRHAKVVWISVGINAVVALTAAGFVVIAAPLIMRAYGRDFAGGTTVLGLLSLAAAFTATSYAIGQSIISAGRMWWALVLNGVWGAIALGVTWALRDRGATGLAWGQLAAYAVHVFTSAYFAWRVQRWLSQQPEPSTTKTEQAP